MPSRFELEDGAPTSRLAWNRARDTGSLLSISSIYHRSKSVSRRKTSRTSAHFRDRVSDPYPPHYTLAFASSDILLPHPHRLASQLAFLHREDRVRGSQVPLVESIGLGACFRPGDSGPRCPTTQSDIPPPVPFGSSLSTSLACLNSRPLRRFTCVHHTDYLTPHPDEVSRTLPACHRHASAHCPGSSLFIPVDSPGGTGGSRPIPVRTNLTSDFLSQAELFSGQVHPMVRRALHYSSESNEIRVSGSATATDLGVDPELQTLRRRCSHTRNRRHRGSVAKARAAPPDAAMRTLPETPLFSRLLHPIRERTLRQGRAVGVRTRPRLHRLP